MVWEQITFRAAEDADLPAVVSLLADDDLGQLREDPRLPLAREYLEAFQAIKTDSNQLLVFAQDGAGVVIGTLQISFIPGIAPRGSLAGADRGRSDREGTPQIRTRSTNA
jgi:hypothetical protein